MTKFTKFAVVAAFALMAFAGVKAYASVDVVAGAALHMGSSGQEVMDLQAALNAAGYMPALIVDGSFGAKTDAAVKWYQAAHGLTVDGWAGVATAASLNGMAPVGCPAGLVCTPTAPVTCPAGYTCTPVGGGGATGTEGDISSTSFDELSTADSSFQEGETNEVFGFTFEVEGDVTVDRVDILMEIKDDTTASNNADDYFSGATLMVDGDEVESLDVEDWEEGDANEFGVDDTGGSDDEYRLRFSSLDLDFNDGDEPEFTVSFDVNSSIDTTDLAGDWIIEINADAIRFVDGAGFDDEVGDASITETVGADSEDTAELSIQNASEDPDASVLEVSSSDTTEEVVVFMFDIEEENDVDVTVNDLTVTITTGATTGTTDEAAVITDAFLYDGSTLLGSENVPTGGEVNFENLDLAIDGDDSVTLTLKLSFADADEFTAGTDVSATITASTDIDDAEDANGNDEGDMTLSGSATSETHSLRTEGIMVTFDDSSYLKTSSDTTGINETVEFTLEFDVTAFGDDMYIDETCGVDGDGTYLTSQISVSLDNDTNGSSTTCTDFDSDAEDTGSGFEVLEGETAHFTVTILGNGGEAGGAGSSVTFTARINNIGYNVGADGAGDTSYAFEMDNYESDAVTVFDR